MEKKKNIEEIIKKNNFSDYKWIKTKDIVVEHWVRMKCIFGCSNYGECAACPPNVPAVDECRKIISEYEDAVLFHFEKVLDKPEDRKLWCRDMNLRLLDVEKAVFLEGHYKAFLLFFDSCHICKHCHKDRKDCKYKASARPSPEGFGINVFATVRKSGYSIEVLKDYKEKMNRFAILLVE